MNKCLPPVFVNSREFFSLSRQLPVDVRRLENGLQIEPVRYVFMFINIKIRYTSICTEVNMYRYMMFGDSKIG